MVVIGRNVRTGQFNKVRLDNATIQKMRPMARYVIHPVTTKQSPFFVYLALAFCIGFIGITVLI